MEIFFTKSQNIIKPNIILATLYKKPKYYFGNFYKKVQILFWQLLQKAQYYFGNVIQKTQCYFGNFYKKPNTILAPFTKSLILFWQFLSKNPKLLGKQSFYQNPNIIWQKNYIMLKAQNYSLVKTYFDTLNSLTHGKHKLLMTYNPSFKLLQLQKLVYMTNSWQNYSFCRDEQA